MTELEWDNKWEFMTTKSKQDFISSSEVEKISWWELFFLSKENNPRDDKKFVLLRSSGDIIVTVANFPQNTLFNFAFKASN